MTKDKVSNDYRAKIYQFDVRFIWLINACKHNQEVTVEMEVGIVDSAIIDTIREGPNGPCIPL